MTIITHLASMSLEDWEVLGMNLEGSSGEAESQTLQCRHSWESLQVLGMEMAV